MSSMRSASSITRIFTSDSRIEPRSNMSISRPGVAISTSTPRISTSRLVGHALAADDQRVGELQVLAVLDEVLRHLQGELARRLQDQAARHARPGPRAGQDVEHRQGEAGGLAGAGLRRAQHVAPHQHDGDRLLLDRRRMPVAHLGDGAQHRLGQAEIGEQRARGFFADRCRHGFDRRVLGRFRRGGRGIVQIWSSRWLVAALRRSTLARSRQPGDVPRVTSGVSGVNA